MPVKHQNKKIVRINRLLLLQLVLHERKGYDFE